MQEEYQGETKCKYHNGCLKVQIPCNCPVPRFKMIVDCLALGHLTRAKFCDANCPDFKPKTTEKEEGKED